MRALNTRLGIAIGAGHAAGGAMCFLGTLLVLRRIELSTAVAGKAPPGSTIIEECATLCAIAAVAGAVSTCAFPRHTGLLARCALAWIACAAPIVAVVAAAAFGSDTKRVWWNLHAAMRSPAAAVGVVAALVAPLASLVLAALASPVLSAIEMQFHARHRQVLRARAAHTEPGSTP